MSLLNSKFDIVSVDNPVALASLAQVLKVPGGMTLNSNGTPVAGTLQPGTIVTMNASGEAVAATSPEVRAPGADGVPNNLPILMFVTVDGNVDYSGAFVQKLTVLHGGVTVKTDQINGASFTPGQALTANAGRLEAAVLASGLQVVGFVGPAGYDAVEGVLEVVLPQGAGI